MARLVDGRTDPGTGTPHAGAVIRRGTGSKTPPSIGKNHVRTRRMQIPAKLHGRGWAGI